MKKKEEYIDGFKGIACMGVFLLHFYDMYSNGITAFQVDHSSMDLVFGRILKPLMDGALLVMMFALVSGWLVSQSQVDDFHQFLSRTLHRYLRFILPIIPLLFLIWVVNRMGLFYAVKASDKYGIFILKEEYLPEQITFSDGIRQILYKILISLDNTWDSPFWMLGGIFWGSIIIYFLTWIRPKLHSDSTWTLLAVAIMAASYWLWESTSVMVILGALIHWHYDRIEKINDHVFFIITAFTIMMVYGLQHYLLEVGLHFTDIPYAFDYTLWWRMLYQCQ